MISLLLNMIIFFSSGMGPLLKPIAALGIDIPYFKSFEWISNGQVLLYDIGKLNIDKKTIAIQANIISLNRIGLYPSDVELHLPIMRMPIVDSKNSSWKLGKADALPHFKAWKDLPKFDLSSFVSYHATFVVDKEWELKTFSPLSFPGQINPGNASILFVDVLSFHLKDDTGKIKTLKQVVIGYGHPKIEYSKNKATEFLCIPSAKKTD